MRRAHASTEGTSMRPSLSFVASTTASTAWRYALAFFLVVVAIGLVYLLVKAGKALASVDKMVSDLDREMVPLMGKVGTTVDEVNAELDKVNEITSSVVDMTQKIARRQRRRRRTRIHAARLLSAAGDGRARGCRRSRRRAGVGRLRSDRCGGGASRSGSRAGRK